MKQSKPKVPPFEDLSDAGRSLIQRRAEQWKAAARHYDDSEPDRKKVVAASKRAKSSPIQADSKTRVAKRRSLIPDADGLALERIIGTTDFLHVNYLARGLSAARAVGRINILSPLGVPAGMGTGFLISPSLLLTNHHVLPDVRHARNSTVEFDFEYDEQFRPRQPQLFELDPDQFYYSDKELDFCIVGVAPTAMSGIPLDRFGSLRLIEESGKALVGEKVSVIQHPGGMYKQLAVRAASVENPEAGHFVHYEADTLPGSSGAPVFNDQWQVVALHHSGVPARDDRGRILCKDGSLYRSGQDPEDIHWIANEGLRISSLFEHLMAKGDWTESELRQLVALTDPRESSAQYFSALLAEASSPAMVRVVESHSVPGDSGAGRMFTMREFQEMLDDPDLSEADLAPFFRELPADSFTGIDPRFVFDETKIAIDHENPQESALALNGANAFCKMIRHRRYAKKIKAARRPGAAHPIRIVAEGDSWFQYPFRLHDVVDHLMDRDDLAVLCYSDAGDILSNMVTRGEFFGGLERETPSFFMISGGGNDLVHGRGLLDLLHPYREGRAATDYLNENYARFRQTLAANYKTLFRRVINLLPNVRILCHSYSYVVPNNGKWLGKPMASQDLGITDGGLQAEIVRLILDDVTDVIRTAVAAAGSSVRFLDLRQVVPDNGWHDEFHPTDKWYGEIAKEFEKEIRR